MKHILFLLAALSLLFSAAAGPQPAAAQGDPSAQIDAYLSNLAKQENFSGQALVAKDGNILFEKAYGLANREHDVPNTLDTRFAIADITTAVTAAAILMLQDQGKLNVNDRVCKYLDNCPKKWELITLKQLLNSTAGIVSYMSQPKIMAEMNLRHTPNQLIDIIKSLPVTAEPGSTRWSYSPSSYVLLGKVIEKVSGMTYAQFVKDNIFDKLGMTNTGVDDTTRVLKNRAEGYTGANTKGKFVDASNYYGFGSLYSTVDDLFKFQQAVMNDKLLSPQLTREMLTPSTDPFNEDHPMRVGYAWGELVEKANGLRYKWLGNFESAGGTPTRGFGGGIEYFPDQKVTLIILSNSAHDYTTIYEAALPWLKSLK